jgi:PIN domain nuclease of toxin-antitoxin system
MILLDTCVLFWLELGPERISPKAREAMQVPTAQLFASAISAFELGLKVRSAEIELPMPAGKWLREACERRGIRVLPLDEEAVGVSTSLPKLHRDPCDRFLIATAQLAGLAMVTPDDKICQYPNLKVIW